MITFSRNVEFGAVQKSANIVDIESCCKTSIYYVFYLQKSASIQPRTSRSKLADDTHLPPPGQKYRAADAVADHGKHRDRARSAQEVQDGAGRPGRGQHRPAKFGQISFVFGCIGTDLRK